MQTSWPGVTEKSHRDPWGNVYCSWTDRKGQTYCNKLFLCPWDKDMDQVRFEASQFHSNVLVPEGWLYVCTHCGSCRMDRYGLSSYNDAENNLYVWDAECIKNAVLVSEEEYRRGRELYEQQKGHR